ncbi:MAG: Undecaprenyl-diphosphatase [candidate division WS2 bacterium]|uniref:Undecaprenyl-diphosphatase n=1 Tax=Psychracetigena formicireducens TaxID=2986056 RepID=A0A9E2BGX2_PSYF1|nr:Undecaprenyl-diphosphatase [Candidatus Psychracetigena formicireducens]MBT9144366.1 Undecaprenyl-diphosphatase [Candidatus Psychracetigena formicireducens]
MSETVKIIILAIVQGLTEFLPISSSGHITIFYHLLNLEEPILSLQVYLHLGTSLAVLLFLYRELKEVLTKNSILPILKMVIIGSIPAGMVGIFFKDFLETIFHLEGLLPLFFLINSIILISSYFIQEKNIQMVNIKPIKALLIGIFQALAILPGISRSGSTISGGLLLGLKRKEALLFSLLLSIVAIWGGSLLEIMTEPPIFLKPSIIAGVIISFVTGYFSLWLIKKALDNNYFYLFGIYTLFLSVFLWIKALFI